MARGLHSCSVADLCLAAACDLRPRGGQGLQGSRFYHRSAAALQTAFPFPALPIPSQTTSYQASVLLFLSEMELAASSVEHMSVYQCQCAFGFCDFQ